MPDTMPITADTGTLWRSLSSPYAALSLKLTPCSASTALAVLTIRQDAKQRHSSQRRSSATRLRGEAVT